MNTGNTPNFTAKTPGNIADRSHRRKINRFILECNATNGNNYLKLLSYLYYTFIRNIFIDVKVEISEKR